MSKTTDKLNINDFFTRELKTTLRELAVNTELLFHKLNLESTPLLTIKEIEDLLLSMIKGDYQEPIHIHRYKNGEYKIITGSDKVFALYLYYNSKYIINKNYIDNVTLKDILSYNNEGEKLNDKINSNFELYPSEYSILEGDKLINLKYSKLNKKYKTLIDNGMPTIIYTTE